VVEQWQATHQMGDSKQPQHGEDVIQGVEGSDFMLRNFGGRAGFPL
jgi:hypothetical protein